MTRGGNRPARAERRARRQRDRPSGTALFLRAGRRRTLWRPAAGTPDFEIDFIDAPADKCVNKPKPSKKLPKPKCVKGKSCYTIRPTSDHYGCHAYVITLHRDPSQGGDVKTDPEIEVDR